MNKRKNGFTLIELVAVLVILAIIALIVTPLVMNIVKKAKDSSNKRSIDAYGKAVELAVAMHLLDYGEYPTSLDNLTVEYTGNEVVCNIQTLNEDGSIYLSECLVNGTEVKDSSTEDGYYHYGKILKVYQSYEVGDKITYNGIDFYVISPSDEKSEYITLLKAEFLTLDELNLYGANSVDSSGRMAYYTSETCDSSVSTDCKIDYESSDIKKVVDQWSEDQLIESDLTEDKLGYKTRLITFEELITNLGYSNTGSGTIFSSADSSVPEWVYVYNNNWRYWTMSSGDDSNEIWIVDYASYSKNTYVHSPYVYYQNSVRPVINLKKSAIE